VAATMLTAQQVQDLLDVDASTVYRMAGDGRLPAVRIGRQWRFPAAAIEALLAPAGVPTSRRPSGASPGPALPGRQAGVWTAPAAPAAPDAGEAIDLDADGAHRATPAGVTTARSGDELLA
jgi:excisionase family DNA binding protein